MKWAISVSIRQDQKLASQFTSSKTTQAKVAIKGNVISAMLAQGGEKKVEHAVYCMSKKMLPFKEKYSHVE